MSMDLITGEIIATSIRMHRDLGPGLLESVYESILARLLQRRGLRVRRQQPVRITYAGMRFEDAFRADLIIEDCVVVEVKAVARLDPVVHRQLLTYLRLLNLRLGLVVNFGEATLRCGVKRVVNNMPSDNLPQRMTKQPDDELQP
ncbi:MAG: GxxExxY protein [Gemmatimonadaceae bacterium]|nr:GxxExxY protein [Gemmatimonadaceae bacterium]